MDEQTYLDALMKMQEHYARQYFHLAAEYMRTFGNEGEKALRQSIRELGHDRGQTTRKGHLDKSYPIHLKTLFTAGGFPSKGGFRRNQMQLTPDRRISETLHCPLHEWWQKFGALKEAVPYCEEIHAAMWSAYHPDIETNQPKIMTRGEDVCRFEVFLESAADQEESVPVPEPEAEERLHRMLEIWAKMYYYLARGLIRSFGAQGEAALRRAIRRFGRERGQLMRQDHLARGYDINLKSLFTHYDLPVDVGFERRPIEFGPDVRRSETLICKYHDVWKQYPDGNQIGKIYCEEIHHQIFAAYDPATQINLTSTLTQDEDRCRFAIFLRPANRISDPDWLKSFRSDCMC